MNRKKKTFERKVENKIKKNSVYVLVTKNVGITLYNQKNTKQNSNKKSEKVENETKK